MRIASNDELLTLMNDRSTLVCDEACSEVHRRQLYSDLARAILSGKFTRATGRICAANTFLVSRPVALIGFESLLETFRTEKVPEVLTNTLLVLVLVRHRIDELKQAIHEAKARFHDSETVEDLDGALCSLQSGRISDYAFGFVPDPSFGFGDEYGDS